MQFVLRAATFSSVAIALVDSGLQRDWPAFALFASLGILTAKLVCLLPADETSPKTTPTTIPTNRLDAGLLYELGQLRLSLQIQAIDTLDSKLGLILSIGSAEVAAAAALLALKSPSTALIGPGVLIGAFGAYVVLAGVAVRALLDRSWVVGPPPLQVIESYGTSSIQEVKLKTAESLFEAFDANQEGVLEKGLAFRIGLVAFTSETLVVVAALALIGAQL